jgi:hypothetical protein
MTACRFWLFVPHKTTKSLFPLHPPSPQTTNSHSNTFSKEISLVVIRKTLHRSELIYFLSACDVHRQKVQHVGSGQSTPVLVRGLTQSTTNFVSASVRRSHTFCGALPARELPYTRIVFRFLELPSSDGKVPVKEFWSN